MRDKDLRFVIWEPSRPQILETPACDLSWSEITYLVIQSVKDRGLRWTLLFSRKRVTIREEEKG